MKVKEESEKAVLKFNIQKFNIKTSSPITSWWIRKKWKQWQTIFPWAPKSLWTVTAAIKVKDACSLEGKLWQTSCVKKQRHHLLNKGPYSQSYGFSSRYVQMRELDCKESWAPKNWCCQTLVLEKSLESPLDSKEIKPVNPKGNQPWIFIGRTDVEAESPILWPDAKNWLIRKDTDAGKDWGQEEKGTTGWDD